MIILNLYFYIHCHGILYESQIQQKNGCCTKKQQITTPSQVTLQRTHSYLTSYISLKAREGESKQRIGSQRLFSDNIEKIFHYKNQRYADTLLS